MSRFRYAYLFAALILVIFVRPFIEDLTIGVIVVNFMLLAMLITGAFAAADHKHQYAIVAVLAALAAGTQLIWAETRSDISLVSSLAINVLFLSSIVWSLVRKLFAPHKSVTSNTIFQALSAYLLLGLVWSSAYALLEHITPGSFAFTNTSVAEITPFDRFTGFSFTTLTTLGYGNVAPATPKADALSTLQATIGQVYLAIVIARLVAIQIGQQSQQS